jgi:DNA-binding transcriptional LysR family regulator
MYSYRLQVFHAVATAGSFSRAAREILHISQPAVSKHVQALEEELGVPLLQRVGKRLILTEAGRIVQRYAEQVLALAADTQQALRELQGLQRGTLRLGASSTPGIYLLPPVLATFVQRYPGITLALEIANSQRVVDGVLARQWDLGMIGIPLEHPHLHVQPYWRDTLVLIVAPHHRLATRSAVTLADLAGETWISTKTARPRPGGQRRAQQGVSCRPRWQGSEGSNGSHSRAQDCHGVRCGDPRSQQGVLQVVPITDVQAERDLCGWRHDSRLPAAVRAFLEVLHAQAPREKARET